MVSASLFKHKYLVLLPTFVIMSNKDILNSRFRPAESFTNRQLFLNHIGQTSPSPLSLEIVKAEGCKMWDVNGKEYIDLIAGITVCNVGHRHPKVITAIKQQLDEYMHVMVYGEIV